MDDKDKKKTQCEALVKTGKKSRRCKNMATHFVSDPLCAKHYVYFHTDGIQLINGNFIVYKESVPVIEDERLKSSPDEPVNEMWRRME